MLYTDLTKQALADCFRLHKDETDKSGTPYVFHPYHIAEKFNDETHIVVALLHDVVESLQYFSVDAQLNYIRQTYGTKISCAIVAITRRKTETYSEYITRVAQNQIARDIKIEDIAHNMDMTRLNLTTDAEIKAAKNLVNKRYRPALVYLMEGYTKYKTFDEFHKATCRTYGVINKKG